MNICRCFDVSRSELKKVINNDHNSIDKLSDQLPAGSHCGGSIKTTISYGNYSSSQNKFISI
ncbi:MAG: (2Fe-2S)-binding protein [Methylococcaceae bacterium]